MMGESRLCGADLSGEIGWSEAYADFVTRYKMIEHNDKYNNEHIGAFDVPLNPLRDLSTNAICTACSIDVYGCYLILFSERSSCLPLLP